MNREELTVKKDGLSEEEIQKMIQSFNVVSSPFCSHCGADHRPNWCGDKRYKPLSSGGCFSIGHCCLDRFDDWIIIMDLVRDGRISEEDIKLSIIDESIRESTEGKLIYHGSFAQYVDSDDDSKETKRKEMKIMKILCIFGKHRWSSNQAYCEYCGKAKFKDKEVRSTMIRG
jgi:hypothetical protein